MQEYVIFKYHIAGQDHIEAYPTHGYAPEEILKNWLCLTLPDTKVCHDGISFLAGFVSAVSRTQARKAAYINWVDSTGKGFNKYPLKLSGFKCAQCEEKYNIKRLRCRVCGKRLYCGCNKCFPFASSVCENSRCKVIVALRI